MRSLLKGLALVVLGFLLSLFFLFTCNVSYTHVYQQNSDGAHANQRVITLAIQPFWPSPSIDLFHPAGGK